MDLFKGMSQTVLTSGEQAIRLFLDLVSVVSERVREATGQPRPLPMEPTPSPRSPPAEEPWAHKPAIEPAQRVQPKRKAPVPARVAGGAKPKAKAKKKASAKGGVEQERPDQMIRVLELLVESGQPWLSAKELSDAGAAAGTPILPGNVRKVIRARGEDLIETRPRDGSRRGALEYRITDAGRRSLGT